MSVVKQETGSFVVDGISFWYRRCGRGPRLLLIHGFAVSSVIWSEMLTSLTHHFEVITLDLPAFGSQPQLQSLPTLQTYSDFLASAIDIIRPDYLIGYSMGANICFACSQLHNLPIKKLILISPVLPGAFKALFYKTIFATIGSSAMLTKVVKIMFSQVFFRYAFFAATQLADVHHPYALNTVIGYFCSELNPPAIFSLVSSVFDIPKNKNGISTPLSFVVGDRDGVAPLSAIKHQAKSVSAQLRVIPRTYHLIPLEQPQLLSSCLHDLLLT